MPSSGGGGCGRAATIIIACSDSSDDWKGCADYVLDGTADEQQFNDAITRISALDVVSPVDEYGGRILVSEGHVHVNAPILLGTGSADGIVIEGQGSGTIFRIQNAATGYVSNDGVFLIGVVGEPQLRNFRIDGNKANNAALQVLSGFRLIGDNSVSGILEGLVLENAPGEGIRNGGTNLRYLACEILNSKGLGMRISSTGMQMIDCDVIGGEDDGVWILTDSGDGSMKGCQVATNTGLGMLYGSDDWRIVGNLFRANTSHGIQVGLSSRTVFGNNIVVDNNGHGFDIGANDNSGNIYIGNLVERNSQGTDNTSDGIHLRANSDKNALIANIVRHGGGLKQHRYGINVSAATCDQNLVAANDLLDSGRTGEFNDAGTGTRGATDGQFDFSAGNLTPESVEITGGPLAFRGDISPAQIAANQNDYNPAGLADAVVLRLSSDAARSITGLAGGADGRVLILLNVGTFTITLEDDDAGSAAANRFALAADFPLDADEGLVLWYDSTSARWRLWGQSEKGAAGSLTDHNHTATAGDGGVLTADEHDSFSELTEIVAPATPAANKVRIYAKDSAGVSRLFYKDDGGTERGPLDTPGAAGAHDHTTADGSGVLTGDEHDGFSEYAEIVAPASPAADKLRLYAKDDAGTTKLFYKRSTGTEVELGAGAAAYQDSIHIHTLTAPVNGDFAWINQGGASVSQVGNGVFLTGPGGTTANLRIRKKAAPATPYTITAYVRPGVFSKTFLNAGMCFRQSSDGKIATLDIQGTAAGELSVVVNKWTDPTTFSATYLTISAVMPPFWLRIADDGTDRISSISFDGENFIEAHRVGRADFLTADEVGFFVNANNQATPNYDVTLALLSWVQA